MSLVMGLCFPTLSQTTDRMGHPFLLLDEKQILRLRAFPPQRTNSGCAGDPGSALRSG